MDDDFLIPVNFKGKSLELPARLLSYTYTYKIEVDLEYGKLLFERDDECNWRALLKEEDIIAHKKIDKELIEAVVQSLDELLA